MNSVGVKYAIHCTFTEEVTSKVLLPSSNVYKSLLKIAGACRDRIQPGFAHLVFVIPDLALSFWPGVPIVFYHSLADEPSKWSWFAPKGT
jgi:hypothetical protein